MRKLAPRSRRVSECFAGGEGKLAFGLRLGYCQKYEPSGITEAHSRTAGCGNGLGCRGGPYFALEPVLESRRRKMGILLFIVFGLVVGFIARALLPGRQSMGFLMTAVLGMVGSLVGGFVGNLLAGR